jgi:ribonucleoside-diphosphate reductase alpha chain
VDNTVVKIQHNEPKEKVFSNEESLRACVDYYDGDSIPATIVHNKYLMRDKEGQLKELTPRDMHFRLASEFTRIEHKFNPDLDVKEFFRKCFNAFDRFSHIVPQGSPMAAIGNPYQIQSLSNCFVVDSPKDTMEGIFTTGLELSQIYKRRGGCGTDMSTLRPMGSRVNNAAVKSTGVPCFSDFFSHITRMTGQAGRSGALMLSISVEHPDIEHFIKMKSDQTKVTGANVSIKITDAFMRAVQNDENFTLRWPLDVETPKITKTVKAREIWDQIVEQAWKNAEPGLLMWDNITKSLPAHNYPGYHTVCTNPCGEIPLSPYDSCRLMSMNLMGYVVNPFTHSACFDFDKYYQYVKFAQRLSDNLVELELEAVDKIRIAADTEHEKLLWTKVYDTGKNGRRTGLGTHALADVFLAIGIQYDSEEALAFTDKVYSTHKIASYESSVELARERGAFPIWNYDIDTKSEFIQNLPEKLKEEIRQYGRRNISNLTLAPTGSVAIASLTSSGCEPVFRFTYDRRVKIVGLNSKLPVDFTDAMGDKWSVYRVIHPAVKKYYEVNGLEFPAKDLSLSSEEVDRILADSLPKHFVTSAHIDYMMGVKLQATIQKHIDHSISKTINMPKGTKKEEVDRVYFEAWKLGLKGVTIYVDGSRDGVLITSSKKKDKDVERPVDIVESHSPKRPQALTADIHSVKIAGCDWSVVIGILNGKPFEIFAGKGLNLPKNKEIEHAQINKKGKNKYQLKVKAKGSVDVFEDITEIYESDEQRVIARSVCRELRHGIPVEFIIKDLQDHSGSISDFSSSIARVLKKYANRPNYLVKYCPECSGTNFIFVEGCATCSSCNWSKCN